MTDKQAGGMTFSYPHEHFHSDDTEDDLKADWVPEVDPIHTPTTKEPSYWDDPKPDHFASLSYQALEDALGRLAVGFESPTEYTEEDAPYEGKHPLVHKLVKSIEDAGDSQPGDPDYSGVEFPPDHESAPKNAAKEHKPLYSNTNKEYTGQCSGCSWGSHYPSDRSPAETSAHFKHSFDDWHNVKNGATYPEVPLTKMPNGRYSYPLWSDAPRHWWNRKGDSYCPYAKRDVRTKNGVCPMCGGTDHEPYTGKESSMTYKEAHDMVNDLASGHMPSHPSKQDQEDEAGILDLFSDMADDAGTYVEQPSKHYRKEHHMGVDMRALDHDYADISHSVDEHLFDNPQPIAGGYKEPLPDDQKNKIKAHPLPQIPKDHKTIKPWSADHKAVLGFRDADLPEIYDAGYDAGRDWGEDQLNDGSLSNEEIIEDATAEEGPQQSGNFVDDDDAEAYEHFMKGFIKAIYDEIEGRAKIDASLANPDRTMLAARVDENGVRRKDRPADWDEHDDIEEEQKRYRSLEPSVREKYDTPDAPWPNTAPGPPKRSKNGAHSDYNEEHIDRHLLDDKSDSWYDDDDDKPWPHTAPGPPKRPKTGTHEDYNEEHIDRHLLDDKSDSWYDDDDGKPWPDTAPGPPKRPHHADRQEFLRGYHDGLAKGESGAEPNGASAFPAEKNVGWPQGDAPPKSGNPQDWGYAEGFAGGMADGANGLFLPRRKNAPPPSKQASRKLGGESVEMASIPDCDVCKMNGKSVPAVYDARLPGAGGSWGYVCQRHFDELGPGQLGTGHGQRLIKRESSRHLGGSDWADELLETNPPCVVCSDRANNMVKDDYEKQFVPVCDEHRGSDGYVKRYDGDEHHQGSRVKIAATVEDFLNFMKLRGDEITLTTGVPSNAELIEDLAAWGNASSITPQEVEDYVYSKQAAFRRRAAEIDSDDYRYGYMDGKDWGSDQESGWTNANAIEALTDIFGGPNQTPREGDYEKGFLDGAHAAKPRPSQSQIDHGASLKRAVTDDDAFDFREWATGKYGPVTKADYPDLTKEWNDENPGSYLDPQAVEIYVQNHQRHDSSLKVAVGARPYIDKKTRQTGWHCKECSIGKRTAQYGEAKALADNHNNWYHHELRKRQAMRHQGDGPSVMPKTVPEGTPRDHSEHPEHVPSHVVIDHTDGYTWNADHSGPFNGDSAKAFADQRNGERKPGTGQPYHVHELHKVSSTNRKESTVASRNEAGQQRRTLVAAVATQQKMINALAAQNELLRRGIVTIASAAGITRHPRLAGLITLADNGDPVATSTDEARKPDATDNVDSYGAAPAGANVGVDPEANTDVTQYTTTLPEDAINDLIDVTAPVPGTDAPWGPAVGEQVPTLLTNPDITPMDNMSGWKSSRRHQGTGVYTVGDNDGDGGEPDSRPEDDETSPGGKHTRDPNGISPEDMKSASLWRYADDNPASGSGKSNANTQPSDSHNSGDDGDDDDSDDSDSKDSGGGMPDFIKDKMKDKQSSRDPQVRLFAAMKLAKTRIALGMGSGDELADAQRICDDPAMSTQAIRSLTSELDRVTASVQSERRTASRSRVPQRADGVERTMPSVQAQSSRPHVESGPGTPTSEEFGDLG